MKPTSKTQICLAFAAGLVAPGFIHASALIYEPFAQTAGSISGKAGGDGLGNWAVTGTASTVATASTFFYGQTAFSDREMGLPTGAGNSAYVTTTSVLADDGLLDDGATLWFSYFYSKAAGGGSNETSGFAFGSNRIFQSGTNGVFMNGSGNGLGVYSRDKSIQPARWSNGGAPTIGSGTTFANYGDTVLVVGRIVWGATSGDAETLTIWTPNAASLPVDVASLGSGWSTTLSGVDQTAFNTISMAQRNSGGTQTYDEIRFGADLADVIPVDTVDPTLLSIQDDQGGGPIYEDVVAVTYSLTFDRDMDLATITDADFANVGTASATVGTVTQLTP